VKQKPTIDQLTHWKNNAWIHEKVWAGCKCELQVASDADGWIELSHENGCSALRGRG
jgi:hypothetical protein